MYPKKVKCPYCPATVVVYGKEEEQEVKALGCGLKGCPRIRSVPINDTRYGANLEEL